MHDPEVLEAICGTQPERPGKRARLTPVIDLPGADRGRARAD